MSCGCKRSLDNEEATSEVPNIISGDLLPDADNKYNIGSFSNPQKRWKNISLSGTINSSQLTTNQAMITTTNGAISSEAQLAASRGGTGSDSSAATGIPHVSNGAWTYTTITHSDPTTPTKVLAMNNANMTTGTTTNFVFGPTGGGNRNITFPSVADYSVLGDSLAQTSTNKTFDSTSTMTGVKIASFTPDGIHTLTAPTVTDTLAVLGNNTFTGTETFNSTVNFAGLTATKVVALDGSKNATTLSYSSTTSANALLQQDANGMINGPRIVTGSSSSMTADAADNSKSINLDAHLANPSTTLSLQSTQTSTQTLPFPNVAASDQVATKNATQTFTNKTLDSTCTATGVRCGSVSNDGTHTTTFPAGNTGTVYQTLGGTTTSSVTQLTSLSTGVTLNQPIGTIKLFSTIGAASTSIFTFTNSFITANSVVMVNVSNTQSLTSDISPVVSSSSLGAGSCTITVGNNDGTHATSAAPIVNFWIV